MEIRIGHDDVERRGEILNPGAADRDPGPRGSCDEVSGAARPWSLVAPRGSFEWLPMGPVHARNHRMGSPMVTSVSPPFRSRLAEPPQGTRNRWLAVVHRPDLPILLVRPSDA